MKKFLAVATATILCLQSMICIAADDSGKVEVRPVNADGRMAVNVKLPEEYIKKEVYVYVLNPGMTIDSLVDESMADNMKVLQYNGQKEYNADGISFEFGMNTNYVNSEIEPVYNVYANAEDGKSLTFQFTYYDNNDPEKQRLLAAINNKSVTSSDVKDILEKYSLQYLIELNQKGEAGVIANKLNTLSDRSVDKEEVEDLYIDALLLAAAQNGNLTADIIGEYNDNIGVSSEILSEINNLTDKGIGIVNSDVKVNVTDIASLKTAAEKAILTAAVYGNKNEGNGVLDSVVSKHNAFFVANGLNQTHYTALDKNAAGSKILSGTRYGFDGLVDALNKMITQSSNPGGNGGGTGGGNSGGSGASGTPASMPNVSQDEKVIGFTDLKSVEWARESIERLYKLEVISGKANGIFAPNDVVTREEFVKMICGAFDIQKGKTEISFSDVSADRWSYESINTAASANIVKGDGGMFRPTECITREDMAVILVRVLNSKNVYPAISDYNIPFNDSELIADYAKESVNVLYRNGVINGKSDNMFAPKDNATRAEAAKMICGALDIM